MILPLIVSGSDKELLSLGKQTPPQELIALSGSVSSMLDIFYPMKILLNIAINQNSYIDILIIFSAIEMQNVHYLAHKCEKVQL
jgi:hypothetical protein